MSALQQANALVPSPVAQGRFIGPGVPPPPVDPVLPAAVPSLQMWALLLLAAGLGGLALRRLQAL
ncbi:MAG: hypothetical protein WBC18_11020 [Ottowia sp.]|uniref:hypothetical protein n=1 Tax=Ottowia sp. TaxID=1898956 RepID=UPI003C7067E9